MTHTVAGVVSGVGIAMRDQSPMESSDRMAYLAGAAVGGGVGGRLPDCLEPATSPWHRQVCHGVLPIGSVVWLTKDALAKLAQDLLESAKRAPRADQQGLNTVPLERWVLFFLAGFVRGLVPGYVSHLVLDGCTPCGLPLLGRLD